MSELNFLTLIETEEIDYSPISLGTSWADDSILNWDFGGASHPGMLLVGGSGSGKTHALIQICKNLKERGLGVHVIDSHGDLQVADFDLYSFHYNSRYGINPFAVDPHPELGGPQATVSQVIDLLSTQHTALSTLQKAMFEYACRQMFKKKGIDYKNPETWSYPTFTIDELCDSLEVTLLSNKTGLKANAVERMISVSTKMKKLQEKSEDLSVLTTEEREKLEKDKTETLNEWSDIIQEAKPDDFVATLEKIRSGYSESGMQSLLILLRKIANANLFTGEEPSPNSKSIVYSVRGLELSEQKMIVESILNKIFRFYMRNVSNLNQPPHTYIIIDEIKLFSSGAFKNPHHILNRIQTEARKAGLGLILAGQSLDHVPQDVITNMGATVVLPVHNVAKSSVSRKLQIQPHLLNNIKPRRDGLVSIAGSEFENCKMWS